MTYRGRIAFLTLIVVLVVMPATASAHAYLVKTVPAASVTLSAPPPSVQLTFDEAVEPRFAIISVTNTAGQQETSTSTITRSPSDPDTLVVPLRPHLPRGWYLIYWRAISVDGHPVQGAFTFAIGPDPGPAPRFRVPSIAGSATSLNLLIARWAMLLLTMSTIGLFVFRMLLARPLRNRRSDMSLRSVEWLLGICAVLDLIAIPVYLDFAIAIDSLRSVFDLGALVPLFRTTAFGRAYVDMLICFALFCAAAGVAVWVDRPERPERSLVEITATLGALLAAAAVLVIPGTAGHAAQTSPRGLSVALDWLHLVTGSLWLGGLFGLLTVWGTMSGVRRIPALAIIVPRFSNMALVSVFLLLGTGVWATVNHLPTLDALWLTGYGIVILVKIGLLLAAMALGAMNLLRTKPVLAAATDRPEVAARAATLLRRLVAVEATIVAAAVFAAAILSSLAPPPPSFALINSAQLTAGPGQVIRTITRDGYQLALLVSPNRAAAPNSFSLRITRNGQPVRGAIVTLTFNQTEMSMPQQEYGLAETQPGVYTRRAPALVMVGHWALSYSITPPGGRTFSVLLLDQANG